MVVIKIPVDEKYEEELEKLDNEFQNLKAQISYIRKHGEETFTAELLSLDFTPKLRMAKTTYDPKDLDNLKRLLSDIKAELKESEEGSEFNHAVSKIKEAYEKARHGELDEAARLYSSVVSIYKNIPSEHKRILYRACLDLKAKIDAAKNKKEA